MYFLCLYVCTCAGTCLHLGVLVGFAYNLRFAGLQESATGWRDIWFRIWGRRPIFDICGLQIVSAPSGNPEVRFKLIKLIWPHAYARNLHRNCGLEKKCCANLQKKGLQRFCIVELASSEKQVKGQQFQDLFLLGSNFDCIFERIQDWLRLQKDESGFRVLHHHS